jgi:hypothetical protein
VYGPPSRSGCFGKGCDKVPVPDTKSYRWRGGIVSLIPNLGTLAAAGKQNPDHPGRSSVTVQVSYTGLSVYGIDTVSVTVLCR